MEPAKGVELTGRRITYYQPAKEERQEITPLCLESQGKFFFYKHQICNFSIADETDDFSISIISADSGEILYAWQKEAFYEEWFPELLYVDTGNALWALYPDYMGGENGIFYNIENQKAVEIAPEIVSAFMECGLSSFAVWNNHLVLFGGQKLAVLDLDSGKMSGIWEPVTSYCLDDNGSLYYLLRPSNGNDTLVKYSLEESRGLWSTNELPSMSTQAITDTGRDELFLLDQFALRAMAGGLGDVVMVNGFGLDTRIITNTDAFSDLSAYLDACSFKDELQWNQVETLRGDDGAIRALPLGVVPTYYVWNEERI